MHRVFLYDCLHISVSIPWFQRNVDVFLRVWCSRDLGGASRIMAVTRTAVKHTETSISIG